MQGEWWNSLPQFSILLLWLEHWKAPLIFQPLTPAEGMQWWALSAAVPHPWGAGIAPSSCRISSQQWGSGCPGAQIAAAAAAAGHESSVCVCVCGRGTGVCVRLEGFPPGNSGINDTLSLLQESGLKRAKERRGRRERKKKIKQTGGVMAFAAKFRTSKVNL